MNKQNEYTINIPKNLDIKLKEFSKNNKLTEENNHIESCFYYFLGVFNKHSCIHGGTNGN